VREASRGLVSEKLSILVVDCDERSLVQRADHLLAEGHEISVAARERAARLKLAETVPDVVLLVSLGSQPQTLGLLRALRADEIDGVDPGVRVLSVGADTDALATTHYRAGSDLALPTKASLPLLAAAVEMLGDRAREGAHPSRVLRVGSLIVDGDARTARVGEQSVSLTRLEFGLLKCLAAAPQHTFTKAELAREVWGSEVMARSSRTVDSHVMRVRRKLVDAGATHQVEAIRGVGYRLSR
jgi:DNA-binding response OmpR family regulator